MRRLGLALLLFPLSVHAGFLKEWQLKETASAPVLVTGRVISVQKIERVPEDRLSWKAETWSMRADVEVLRSFTRSGKQLLPHRIEVRFLAYGPNVTFINGNPPPLPVIRTGETHIFPLRENDDAGPRPWQFVAESGSDITIPVRADLKDEPAAPPSARVFLIREFANTLSHGTPAKVVALSGYLSHQTEDLTGELMPLLGQAIGADRQRWAEIAASLHAAQGLPRPTVASLFAAKPGTLPISGFGRGNLPLLKAALRELQPSPATDDLLIGAWMANAPFDAWGSANSLVEYANSSVTTQALRQALSNDLPGSSYIALVLANSGNKTILPDAVARAFRVVDDPTGLGANYSDLQGAAALLRDHGSDPDLTRLAAIVRKYQSLDPKYYSRLWQYATGSDDPREMYVLAVVLVDRRVADGNMRYCDYALGEFDRFTKQQFGGINSASVAERDAAISRALAWIEAH